MEIVMQGNAKNLPHPILISRIINYIHQTTQMFSFTCQLNTPKCR